MMKNFTIAEHKGVGTMATTATETRIPCSKETRRLLSEFKRSPDNWDDTLERVARLARDAESRKG